MVCILVVIVTIAIIGSRAANGSSNLMTSALTDEEQGSSYPPPSQELVHVALLFRHTVRAPRIFPTADPLLRPELFPRGIERSTRKGLEATRNVSLIWKTWYKDFLRGTSQVNIVSYSIMLFRLEVVTPMKQLSS